MSEPTITPAELLAAETASKEERARIISSRNNVMALALVFLVVLFFAITIVKMKI